jgi:hypothetical protein
MEGNMFVAPINSAGWQAINRRVVEWQQIPMLDEHNHNKEYDADLPFSRTEARLEVQKWWWQL